MTRIPTRRGFTLIEIMVVVVLIGLMMGIVVPRFRVSEVHQGAASGGPAGARPRGRALAGPRRPGASRASTFDVGAGHATRGISTPTATGRWRSRRRRPRRSSIFRTRALDHRCPVRPRTVTPDVPGFAGGGSIDAAEQPGGLRLARVDDPARHHAAWCTSGPIADTTAVTAVSISAGGRHPGVGLSRGAGGNEPSARRAGFHPHLGPAGRDDAHHRAGGARAHAGDC